MIKIHIKKYKNLKEFKKYYKKQKKLIVKLIIVMILASSLGMILPYFYSKRLIGITGIDFNVVLKYTIYIIIVILFHHLFWYLWEKLASILKNRVAKDIRKDIIKQFTDISYSEIKHKSSGYFIERINDDTIEVASFLSQILGTIVDCLTNFGFLILIFILNYQCGLIFIVGIALMYIVEVIKIKKDLKFIQRLKILNEKLNTKVAEDFKGIKEIKGLGIKNTIIEEISSLSESISKEQMKKDRIYAFYSRIKTFLKYILEGILIIYSVKVLIPAGNLAVTSLIMIIDYSGFMYDLVEYIATTKDCLEKSEFKAKRLLEIFNHLITDKFGKDNILDKYDICIKNLSYSYEDNIDVKVLEDISFEIKENTANVFIGESGSGKSTLFGLLTKMLSCENNKIFIGEKDINSLSEETFRKSICIINQEPLILNDTILNNIKIVKPLASLKEIKEACKKAHIYKEIINMQDGFDTVISENGNNLSGGQKQRIAIARAILKDAPILLFDEPTSSLDRENQKLFYSMINNLKENKTILIIAHKFENLDMFDNIFELKNGKIM